MSGTSPRSFPSSRDNLGSRVGFTQRNFSGQPSGGSGNLDRSNFGRISGGDAVGAGTRGRDFVAKNFSNSGMAGDPGRRESNGLKFGPSSPRSSPRSNANPGAGGIGDRGGRPGGDFDRGNLGQKEFGRGKSGQWNGGNWDRGPWTGGNWNQHGGGHQGKWDHGKWDHGNWNNHHGQNHWWGGNNSWHGYGRNRVAWNNWYYPGFGLWGWGIGWPWLGWGWGWNNGWGYGGWGGYGLAYDYPVYGYPTTTLYADATDAFAQPQQAPIDAQAGIDDFISAGEQAFRAGQYEQSIRYWQHAMVDNPNNGAVVLLMGQALFALGQYENAANTVQMAMQMLPEGEWGNVVKNYVQLYGNIEDYTNQIRTAEKARDSNPTDGAVRFLLGYHFGYLNYPKQAVRELDKALDIEPRDVGSQKLRDIFAKQAGIPARPPAAGQNPQPNPGQAPPPAAVPPPVAQPPVGTDA